HYRLKGHAIKDFWEWVSSWAISIRKPSDLGFPDRGYVLPELVVKHCYVETDITMGRAEDQLFRAPTMSATNIHKEMRLTAPDRAQAVARIVLEDWLCGRKNTPSGGVQNTNQIPKSGQSGSLKDELLKRIGNTCTPTTRPTVSDLVSTSGC